jgi:transcriptional regulator with XRE-family HTH domain
MVLRTSSNAADLARLRALCSAGLARQIRLAGRLSQADVAEDVGVDPSVISRWETGDRKPRGDAALRYLMLLDLLIAGGVSRGTGAADT